MSAEKILKSDVRACAIVWDRSSSARYDALYAGVVRSNILQSSVYGRAAARLNHQGLRWGVIMIEGQEAGIVQVLEAGFLRNAVHGVLLDRAPLWLDGFGGQEDFTLFMRALSEAFPKRFGRRVRFIPELVRGQGFEEILQDFGYKSQSSRGYKTIFLDLREDLTVLRQKLSKKWRNSLKKSENSALDVVFSDEGAHFSWLMQCYAMDKALRGYDGPSQKLMIALAKEFARDKNMLIGSALLNGEPVASVLIFKHGRSATYQIGYSSDLGRAHCAHHMLLWRALDVLKQRGAESFDLGGIHEDAPGIEKFKKGLGGQIYETVGLYH